MLGCLILILIAVVVFTLHRNRKSNQVEECETDVANNISLNGIQTCQKSLQNDKEDHKTGKPTEPEELELLVVQR